jgi:hypothetical protein
VSEGVNEGVTEGLMVRDGDGCGIICTVSSFVVWSAVDK